MATDQKTSTLGIDAELPGSVIENELPTYRAISNFAIFSLVCGTWRSLPGRIHFSTWRRYWRSCWASCAHRTISRFPDMLTGHGLASAGIALGLIFGLGSGTFSTVQYFRQNPSGCNIRESTTRRSVQSAGLGDVLLPYGHPDGRKDQDGGADARKADRVVSQG